MPDETEMPEQATDHGRHEMLGMVAEIVSNYLRRNEVPASELPSVIRTVYDTLREQTAPSETRMPREPAVPINRSVHRSYVVCLDCGARQSMLRRHLSSAHGLTPEEYRTRWNLPPSYSLVAPEYAARRSELARQFGLGRGGRPLRGGRSAPRPRSPS